MFVLVLGLVLLGIWIWIADKRAKPVDVNDRQTKVSEPKTVTTVQSPPTRLPDGRFGPRSQQHAAPSPRPTRDPRRVTEADFKSRGTPDVEHFILNAPVSQWLDVECPLDVNSIERLAQMGIQAERQKAIITRTGWSMAGGAALVVLCADQSRVWLTMAIPGFIAVVTIWMNVMSGRQSLAKIELASTSLTSTEKEWVGKVEAYLKQRR
jgi:hypothetical protein